MDLKIGANGDLDISVAADGDVVFTANENDTMTSESLVFKAHPQVLSAALIKAFGGGAIAAGIINAAVSALALIPKS